eukprot:5078307-Amphidinium_carterae.1
MKLEVQQRLWVEMIEMMTTFRRLLDSRMSTLLQTQRCSVEDQPMPKRPERFDPSMSVEPL